MSNPSALLQQHAHLHGKTLPTRSSYTDRVRYAYEGYDAKQKKHLVSWQVRILGNEYGQLFGLAAEADLDTALAYIARFLAESAGQRIKDIARKLTT